MADSFLGDFWDFVTEKVKKFPWDKIDDGMDALEDFKAGFEEHGPNIAVLEPHVAHLKPFVQLIDSPITQLATSSIPLLSISVSLLKFYLGIRKTEPTLADAIALTAQLAYLQSFTTVMSQSHYPKALNTTINTVTFSQVFKEQLNQQKSLNLTESNAKRAISDFRTSSLAKAFNQALTKQLAATALSQEELTTLVDRVSWGTQPHLLEAILKLKEAVEPLAEYLRLGGLPGLEKNNSILEYLEREIENLPTQPIFNDEILTGQDLYTPLNVQPLDQTGQPFNSEDAAINIHDWVQQHLNSQTHPRKVLFIQGDAGRGKSLFCKMFAKEVKDKLFPAFIPIIVRLRELQDLDNTLRGKLEALLSTVDFIQSDPGWLTDRNTRFLLILDGFDELILQGQSTNGLRDFLDQVARFQQKSHHQCLITGRPLALRNSERKLAHEEFNCANLLPMDNLLRSQWLIKWENQFGEAEATSFNEFLSACPPDIADRLAREPLLLYLLAKTHHEGHLTAQIFEGTTGMQARIKIYQKSIHWVLDKQREEIQSRITGLESEDLREVLREAALCIIQSGTEIATIKSIEARLTDLSNPVSELFQQAKQSTRQDNHQVLNNLLTSFYFKSGQAHQAGSIEFAHKSFSEFLFAERLKTTLEDWILKDHRNRYYQIREDEFAWQVYDLLGYGALRIEIMDYLRALLAENPHFDPTPLFDRLHRFYLNWSEGYYIDRYVLEKKLLPQRKMLQLQKTGIDCGLREIDIYAGLNVMILLFELHRYSHQQQTAFPDRNPIVFRPDADPNIAEINDKKLRRIIGYSGCLSSAAFTDIVGFALGNANLSHVELNSVRLTSADLSEANLSHAHLINTYLSFANLSGANLHSAKLSSALLFNTNLSNADLSEAALYSAELFGANLSNANLQKADLLRANLSRANLIGANLFHANLNSAELKNAKLSDADLSKAKLEHTNLIGAILHNANLTDTDLYKANLRNADLTGANLTNAILFRANVSQANFQGIRWNKNTDWRDVKGLDRAKNLPDDLRQYLGIKPE